MKVKYNKQIEGNKIYNKVCGYYMVTFFSFSHFL